MSSKNDDTSGIVMAFAFVGAVAFIMAAFVFAVLAFLAFILTILCLFAWNQPRRIGKLVILPEEARAFVYRGLAGMCLLPVFAGFCELLFGIHIKEALYPYLFIGGYVGGSIGIGILMAEQNGGETGAIDITPPQLPSEPQRSLPRPEPEPFRYASWDDEEGRGQ